MLIRRTEPFPTRKDIATEINPPFAINARGSWLMIGIGSRGAILKPEGDTDKLFWLGQILKFSPQDDYIDASTVDDLLQERGIKRAKWQAR